MPDPIKVRATIRGDVADIRVLMNHPMESGLRRDLKTNELVPIHHINHFTISLNGKVVLEAQCNQAVSKNPVFGLRVKDAKPGDLIAIDWQDNQGESNHLEYPIPAPA